MDNVSLRFVVWFFFLFKLIIYSLLMDCCHLSCLDFNASMSKSDLVTSKIQFNIFVVPCLKKIYKQLLLHMFE